MRRYTLDVAGKEYVIDVEELAVDRFHVVVGDEKFEVLLSSDQDLAEAVIRPEVVPTQATGVFKDIQRTDKPPALEALRPLPDSPQRALPSRPRTAENGFHSELKSPMPGTILSVEVAPGDKVSHGQVVLMLEAMKMKNAIKSPQEAVVAEVLVQPRQTVGHGDVLVRFRGSEEA